MIGVAAFQSVNVLCDIIATEQDSGMSVSSVCVTYYLCVLVSVPVFISVSTSVCIITSISASISNSVCVSTSMCIRTFVNFCSIMYQPQCGDGGCSSAVSYTHLTLPTMPDV